MTDFETRSSERVFDGVVASVRIDRVEMPGGGVASREVVEHDRAAAVVALDDAGQVVLIEQYRHPLGHRLWELPAGLMDIDGEDAFATAKRELAEETGLTATDWEVLVDVAVSPGFTTEAVRVFLARGLADVGRQGEIAHEEADLRVVRVPLAEAVDAVLAGRIVNASAVAGLLAADLLVRTGGTGRPADDPWTAGPAVVSPDAPDLTPDPHW
ncbi:NUDIX domain-containing protein [Nakamurella lactea]|uniref:NUDIX domain-containing protein n=1 Tax=Nakamurella lactea TaxID=459515 RepID=UPI0004015422|nr:NUDIX hydrolase [Nakamurella lactea]